MTEFQRAIEKSLILITGQEDLLRTRALQGVFQAANIASDDFDLESFDAQESQPIQWIGSSGTAPFLAERRVVIVRQLLQTEAPKELPGLDSIPPSGLLILVADAVGGSDDRRTKAATAAKNWEELVKKAKGAVLKYEVDSKVAEPMIKQEAQANDWAISSRAISVLSEMTGGSVSRAFEELEKLALFVPRTETISERHVQSIVVASREWKVFQLTDAIVESNPGEALKQLRVLVGSVSKAEDAAFSQILPQVSRSLKLLWQARLSLDQSESLKSPSDRFRQSLPKRPNILAEPPYRQSRLVSMAKSVSLNCLGACLQVVANTDAKLKGSLPGFSTIDTLEVMVLELSNAIRQG